MRKLHQYSNHRKNKLLKNQLQKFHTTETGEAQHQRRNGSDRWTENSKENNSPTSVTNRKQQLPRQNRGSTSGRERNQPSCSQEIDGVNAITARLRYFSDAWKEITNDEKIIHWLNGYEIPFEDIPNQMTHTSCLIVSMCVRGCRSLRADSALLSFFMSSIFHFYSFDRSNNRSVFVWVIFYCDNFTVLRLFIL